MKIRFLEYKYNKKLFCFFVAFIFLFDGFSNLVYAKRPVIREGAYEGKRAITDPNIEERPFYLVVANGHFTGISGVENSEVQVERFDITSPTGQGLELKRSRNKLNISFEEDGVLYGTVKLIRGSNKPRSSFQGYYSLSDELFGLLSSFINIGPAGYSIISLEFTQPHRFFGQIDNDGKFNLIFNSDNEGTEVTTDFISDDEVTVTFKNNFGTFSQTLKKNKT